MTKTVKHTYKDYKKSTDNPVSLSQYRKINGEYMKFLLDLVIKGEEVTFPERFGTLGIKGKKQKVEIKEIDGKEVITGLAPDWARTKKLRDNNPKAKEERRIVFHTNAHTDGIRYKYVWRKLNVIVANKTLYSLVMTRTNKRTLPQHLRQSHQEYLLIRK